MSSSVWLSDGPLRAGEKKEKKGGIQLLLTQLPPAGSQVWGEPQGVLVNLVRHLC